MKKVHLVCLVAVLVVGLWVSGCAGQGASPSPAPASSPAGSVGTSTQADKAKPAPAAEKEKPASAAEKEKPAPAAEKAKPAAPQAPASAKREPTGDLRIAVGALGNEVLDPLQSVPGGRLFMEAIYDNLIGVDYGAKFNNDFGLAEKYEMSPDARTYTFQVRRGVKFHNGDELTAEDVAFSLAKMKDPTTISAGALVVQPYLEKVEVVDRYTVRVTTKQYGFLAANLSALGGTEGYIIPKKYVQEKGLDYFNSNPVGTGPYKFVGRVPGSYIKFEANTNYWRGTPRWKTVTYSLVPEESTRVALLKTGAADLAGVTVQAAAQLQNDGFPIIRRAGQVQLELRMNSTWDPANPLSNEKFREAINVSINREEIGKYIYEGSGHPAVSIAPPGQLGYDPDLPPYRYDPERARAIVRELGLTGFELQYYAVPRFAEYKEIAEALAGYWSAIGLKVKIISADYAGYKKATENIPSGTAILFTHGKESELVAVSGWRAQFHSKGVSAGYRTPELDAMIEAIEKSIDPSAYEKAAKELMRYARQHNLNSGLVTVDEVTASSKTLGPWSLVPMPYYMMKGQEIYR